MEVDNNRVGAFVDSHSNWRENDFFMVYFDEMTLYGKLSARKLKIK